MIPSLSSARTSRTVIAGVLPALAIAGCGVTRIAMSTPDSFSTWSSTPLPPDPAMTALALDGSSCILDPEGGPTHILVQDRRTEATAGFLVSNIKSFGSCIVSSAGGAASAGWGPPLLPMPGPLTIDDSGHGGAVDQPELWEIGGRVNPGASTVTVVLADGHTVVASQLGGYWFAWWPGIGPADRVIATDSTGAEIANIDVPHGDEVPK